MSSTTLNSSTPNAPVPDAAGRRVRLLAGLRRTAFATIVALLIQYGIGLFLYGTTPKSAQGALWPDAFGISLTSGPAPLIVHAVLGSLIVIGAVMSLVRAIQSRTTRMIALTAIAAAAIIAAWFAGDATASDPMGPYGRVMGITTGLAILVYALVLFGSQKAVGRPTR
jgi:hypothetical protein